MAKRMSEWERATPFENYRHCYCTLLSLSIYEFSQFTKKNEGNDEKEFSLYFEHQLQLKNVPTDEDDNDSSDEK